MRNIQKFIMMSQNWFTMKKKNEKGISLYYEEKINDGRSCCSGNCHDALRLRRGE